MKKSDKNMKPANRIKKSIAKVRRATISIADDCHPDHSEAVRARMAARRCRKFSNFVEALIADDVKSAQEHSVHSQLQGAIA
jgi:hypothetical protein